MYAFDTVDKISGVKRISRGIIGLYDKMIRLKGNDRVIPINYLKKILFYKLQKAKIWSIYKYIMLLDTQT